MLPGSPSALDSAISRARPPGRLGPGEERVCGRPGLVPLTAMADIPALVASIDTRLDQLAAQINTLEDARTALQAQTLIAAPAPPRVAGAATKRARRPASQTTKPATAAARPARPAAPPKLSVASATGDEDQDQAPRASSASRHDRDPRQAVWLIAVGRPAATGAGRRSVGSQRGRDRRASRRQLQPSARPVARARVLGNGPADRQSTLDPVAADHRRGADRPARRRARAPGQRPARGSHPATRPSPDFVGPSLGSSRVDGPASCGPDALTSLAPAALHMRSCQRRSRRRSGADATAPTHGKGQSPPRDGGPCGINRRT